MVVAVEMHLCNLTLPFAAGEHSDSFHSYIKFSSTTFLNILPCLMYLAKLVVV